MSTAPATWNPAAWDHFESVMVRFAGAAQNEGHFARMVAGMFDRLTAEGRDDLAADWAQFVADFARR